MIFTKNNPLLVFTFAVVLSWTKNRRQVYRNLEFARRTPSP